MKPDLFYIHSAVANWCLKNRWNRDLPITPAWLSEMLSEAMKLKEDDRKKLEAGA